MHLLLQAEAKCPLHCYCCAGYRSRSRSPARGRSASYSRSRSRSRSRSYSPRPPAGYGGRGKLPYRGPPGGRRSPPYRRFSRSRSPVGRTHRNASKPRSMSPGRSSSEEPGQIRKSSKQVCTFLQQELMSWPAAIQACLLYSVQVFDAEQATPSLPGKLVHSQHMFDD